MRYVLPAALSALFIFALVVSFYTPASGPSTLPNSFTVHNTTFNVSSYALTQQQREQGLMNATITNQTFMLFVFYNSSIYPFWMKNTYSPLDIIWIEAENGTGRIVYAVNATPCVSYDPNQTSCLVYYPKSDANYVIETKSGFMQRNNISIGDPIVLNSP